MSVISIVPIPGSLSQMSPSMCSRSVQINNYNKGEIKGQGTKWGTHRKKLDLKGSNFRGVDVMILHELLCEVALHAGEIHTRDYSWMCEGKTPERSTAINCATDRLSILRRSKTKIPTIHYTWGPRWIFLYTLHSIQRVQNAGNATVSAFVCEVAVVWKAILSIVFIFSSSRGSDPFAAF